MPTADAVTPAPTYGTPSVSRNPCRTPSSPVVPWMIGNTTSTRPGRICSGTIASPAGSSRRNFSGTAPSARRRDDSTAGRNRPSSPTARGRTSYRVGSRARQIVRAEMRETSRSTDRPPKRTTIRVRRHHVTTRTSSTAGACRRRSSTAGGGGESTAITAAARGPVAAGEREVGDVDAGLAEDGADTADDSGDVAIAQVDDRPFRPELERQPVDLDHSGVLPREEGGVGPAGRGAGERQAERAGVDAGLLVPRLADREAAVLRDEHRVDVVDRFGRVRLERALDRGHRDRAKQVLRQSPGFYGQPREMARNQRRKKVGRALGQPHPAGSAARVLGSAERKVHRRNVGSSGERLEKRLDRLGRDPLLGLDRGGAEVRRRDDVGQLQQRVVRVGRLGVEDVEGGAGDPLLSQGVVAARSDPRGSLGRR